MNTQTYWGASMRLRTGLVAAIMLLCSFQAHADLTINNGASLTVQSSSSVNVNCQDIIINAGGTFNLNSATVNNLANLTENAGSVFNNSGGTLESCRPLLSKAFTPPQIESGQVSTLTYTINNLSSSNANSLTFTDSLDAIAPLNEVVVATPSNASTTCPSGNVVATAGSSSINFNGGSLLANNSCTISVAPATAELLVDSVPVLGGTVPSFNLSLSQVIIGPGSSLRATYTINELSGVAVSDIAFTHSLPAGVSFSSAANLQTDCGLAVLMATGSLLTVSNGSLDPNQSCTVSANITSSIAAIYTLSTNDLTSSEGNSGTASGSFVVDAGTNSLGLSKSFNPAVVNVRQRSTLTYTFSSDAAATREFGAFNFTETLPSGLEIAGPANFVTTCDLPTEIVIFAEPGSNTFGLDNAGVPPTAVPVLAAGDSCQVSIDVIPTFAGTHYTELNAFQGLYNAFSTFFFNQFFSAVVPAELEAIAAPLFLQKNFVNDPIAPGGVVTVEYSISNLNRADATSISFTDDFDSLVSGLAVIGSSGVNTCGASAVVSGTGVLNFSGGMLAATQSCTFTVDLSVPVASPQGRFASTSANISANIGTPIVGNQATDDLFIGLGFDFSKEFIDDPVGAGSSVTLRYTITNQSSTDPATGGSFLDNIAEPGLGLNAGSITFPAAGYCGASSSSTIINELSITDNFAMSFSNMELAAGGSCTFDVVIAIPDDAPATSFLSETSSISGIIGSDLVISGTAVDTLTVAASPNLSKEFINSPVLPGNTVTVEYTLTNAADNQTLTDITFTDDLDTVISGLVASTLPADGFCGVGSTISGASTLTVLGANLAASDSCSFSVTLTVPTLAALGAFQSSTSAVNANNAGVPVVGSAATDDLVVSPINFSITQVGGSTAPGEIATLEYQIENLGTVDATSIIFTQSLNTVNGFAATPPLPTSPCGAASTLSGTTFLIFTGGSLAAGSNCSFQVQALVPASANEGDFPITTSNLTATVDGTSVTLPSAILNLTVVAEPSALDLVMSFTPSTEVIPGSTIQADFELSNLDALNTVSAIDFSLDFSTVLPGVSYTVVPTAGFCGVSANASGVGELLSISNASLAANSSCTFSVTLSIPANANFSTTYEAITSTLSGMVNGLSVADALAGASFTTIDDPSSTPTISIGASSASSSNGSAITYLVSYTGASNVVLSSSDISLNTTGSAGGSVSVNTVTTTSANVVVTPTGFGTVGISIDAGTARGAGNTFTNH